VLFVLKSRRKQLPGAFPVEFIVNMDRFGRLVLPGQIRRALQVSNGAKFRAEAMGNKVELILLSPTRKRTLRRKRGLLLVSSQGEKFDAVEALATVRTEHA